MLPSGDTAVETNKTKTKQILSDTRKDSIVAGCSYTPDHINEVLIIESGNETDNRNARVQKSVDRKPSFRGREEDAVVEADLRTHSGQPGEVGRVEGAELPRIDFDGAIAAEKAVVEEDAHFGDVQKPREDDREDEVTARVVVDIGEGKLAACEYDGLGQVLQHEGERACRVAHGVGSVDDDEAIIVKVHTLNELGKLHPMRWADVTAVQQRVRLNQCPLGHPQ